MFTGIITHTGCVIRIDEAEGERSFWIQTPLSSGLELGASVACDGCCLTVTAIEERVRFKVCASEESLRCTTLCLWQIDTIVNLETALCLGQKLDGHIVTGHVDGVGTLLARNHEKGDMNLMLTFSCPETFIPFVAEKGSVAVNGVSLTVNRVEEHQFSVNIIHYTQQETNLGFLHVGQAVNLEADIFARYVARQLEFLPQYVHHHS